MANVICHQQIEACSIQRWNTFLDAIMKKMGFESCVKKLLITRWLLLHLTRYWTKHSATIHTTITLHFWRNNLTSPTLIISKITNLSIWQKKEKNYWQTMKNVSIKVAPKIVKMNGTRSHNITGLLIIQSIMKTSQDLSDIKSTLTQKQSFSPNSSRAMVNWWQELITWLVEDMKTAGVWDISQRR